MFKGCLLVSLLGAILSTGLILPSSDASNAQTVRSDGVCDGTLEVLLLMDQSFSLRTTDPQNLRVSGAQALIASLSDLAAVDKKGVNLSIKGFGEGVDSGDKFELPKQESEANQSVLVFEDKNDDQNTDYVLALKSAVDYFESLRDVKPECKKLIWFTDGAYSIDKPDSIELRKYTNASSKSVIEGQLEAQICGPLPFGGNLISPLSSQIRNSGFSIQMIDLRIEGKETPRDKSERAATGQTIDRLLGSNVSDSCHVNGAHSITGDISSLVSEFYNQGQLALGNYPLQCDLLDADFPASMVKSLAIRGVPVAAGSQKSNVEPLSVYLDEKKIEERRGYVKYVPKNGVPTSGVIRVTGQKVQCFADLDLKVDPPAQNSIYEKAKSSFIFATLYGPGDQVSGAQINGKYAQLDAVINQVPTSATYDPEFKAFKIAIPGPVSGSVEVRLTPRPAGWGGPVLESTLLSVAAVSNPPSPQVAWVGDSRIEGANENSGNLIVQFPSMNSSDEFCIDFQNAKTDPSTVEFVPSQNSLCGNGEQKPVLSTLRTTSSQNKRGFVELPYSARFRPAGSPDYSSIEGEKNISFEVVLTKPLNTGDVALFTFLFLVGSIVLTMGALLLFTNYQLRLPDPSKLRAVAIPLQIKSGSLERASSDPVVMDDLERIQGDRSAYRLPDGIEIRRRRTLNPFANISAFVRSNSGLIGAAPSIGSGFKKKTEVPSTFDQISLVSLNPETGTGTAVALVTPGPSMRAEDVSGQIDSAISRLQASVPNENSSQSRSFSKNFDVDSESADQASMSSGEETRPPAGPSPRPSRSLPERPQSSSPPPSSGPTKRPPGPPHLR